MTISTDGFRIPVTVQLDARTYRAIHVAAQRASEAAKREVTIRELIESRLAAAVTGVRTPGSFRPPQSPGVIEGKKPRGNRLNAEGRARLVEMHRAGASRAEIARVLGCSWTAVAHHIKKLRADGAKGEPNV